MKMIKKILCAALTGFVFSSGVFADQVVNLNWVAGTSQTANITVPDEVADIINANKAAIEQALAATGATGGPGGTVANAAAEIRAAYTSLSSYGINVTNPINTATSGLNGFCDAIGDSLPNSQTQQNVWAEAWIGKILPFPHFGFGINTGASRLDVSSLKDTANALGIDVGGLRDDLVFPTVTADFRVGGFVFPFDVGFTFCSIDTSKISSFDEILSPSSIDFFTIGGDVRYALLEGGGITPKVSVGGGFYYTKGGVSVKDDSADADLDFKSTTLFVSSQVSSKVLFLVPFAGARVLFSKTNVDWSIDADWSKIYTGQNTAMLQNAQKWGLLPTKFSGSGNTGFMEGIRPQLYGGVGLDIFVIDLTLSLSYDFVAKIPAGALSLRFSL
ncbi:hypothetical protein HRI96_05925 [Treponema parvum]|uniref:Uncharacterized protein n=1 Tax=Treponema parvum TaxID=138851 RepID=A0A975EZR4_9SPIR|nr:hypothetical protein [Treponema parvum]QTQ11777.1 hypothetical protein HRI96_05925 [Treponema parvum]